MEKRGVVLVSIRRLFIISIIALLALVLSLAACGGGSTKTVNLNSATEQFYDITEQVAAGSGTVVIACASSGKMIAVGKFKTFGTAQRNVSASPLALTAANNVLLGLKANPAPQKKDVTFEVNFGGKGIESLTVKATDLALKLVDNVWTANATVSRAQLESLFAKTGLSDRYTLVSDSAVATASYEDGIWKAQSVTAELVSNETGASVTSQAADTEPGTDSGSQSGTEAENSAQQNPVEKGRALILSIINRIFDLFRNLFKR